jgi:hypothetical protein
MGWRESMISLLFLDLWGWDDHLPPGQGIGSMVGDEEVVGWSEIDGYSFQRCVKVPASRVWPVIDAQTLRFGPIYVKIHDDDAGLAGEVRAGQIDPTVLGLGRSPDPLAAPLSEAPRWTSALAPFPVSIAGDGRILPGPVRVPIDAWPLIAGMRVRTADGLRGTVIEAGDGVVRVRADAVRHHHARLPRPGQRRIPLVWAVGAAAVGAALSIAVVRWRRR